MGHNEHIIKRLLELWYSLVGQDHHKDRDCWFYIERSYCTYREPEWTVRHHGYIKKDYDETFDTLEKAQEGLIEFLIEACAEEIDTIERNPENRSDTEERHKNYILEKRKQLENIVIDQHYIVEKE